MLFKILTGFFKKTQEELGKWPQLNSLLFGPKIKVCSGHNLLSCGCILTEDLQMKKKNVSRKQGT